LTGTSATSSEPRVSKLAAIVADIAEEMRVASQRGRVADYIPPLACVSPDRFGIAVVLADGTEYLGGDADEPFSIQSVRSRWRWA